MPKMNLLSIRFPNRRHKLNQSITSTSASIVRLLIRQIHTIYLFTHSDLKTILIPQTLAGSFSAFSASAFNVPPPAPFETLTRIPLVALWCYLNLLPFAISNQLHPSSVAEDALNKPWRPLPSRRILPSQAKKLTLVLYPVAILASYLYLGGLLQSIALLGLGFWYNSMGGSDRSFVERNLINGAGFVAFMSGATEVAFGFPILRNTALAGWIGTIGAVVMTTVHVQDMYDRAGDRARGRRTVPLVAGEECARWSIAIAVWWWSMVCSGMWGWADMSGRRFWGSGVVVGIGGVVAWRIVQRRSVREDKVTFRWWNGWMVGLYALPLVVKRF
ncbi:MAG: hypothetical protein Q9219_006134 [cf. Caloplaca sp. 3 TL-2023]